MDIYSLQATPKKISIASAFSFYTGLLLFIPIVIFFIPEFGPLLFFLLFFSTMLVPGIILILPIFILISILSGIFVLVYSIKYKLPRNVRAIIGITLSIAFVPLILLFIRYYSPYYSFRM